MQASIFGRVPFGLFDEADGFSLRLDLDSLHSVFHSVLIFEGDVGLKDVEIELLLAKVVNDLETESLCFA